MATFAIACILYLKHITSKVFIFHLIVAIVIKTVCLFNQYIIQTDSEPSIKLQNLAKRNNVMIAPTAIEAL